MTVVVLSRNRAGELLNTIERLRELPERPPVVVVDNGSSDGTPARVAERFPEVRLIALARDVGSHARTIGVRSAGTPYVAFSDDDSWWEPGTLRRAADLLDTHAVLGLLAARVLVGPQNRLDPTCVAMAESPLSTRAHLPGPPVLGFVACGAIVRRSAYLQARGFHPRYGIGGEEALLAVDMAALGWELVYVDALVAHHHPSLARDPAARRAAVTRNDLWSAWLRRSRRAAALATGQAVRAAMRDRPARRGLVAALAGVSWVARERRPVDERLEAALRQLDAARG